MRKKIDKKLSGKKCFIKNFFKAMFEKVLNETMFD